VSKSGVADEAGSDRQAMARLEAAVGRALKQLESLRSRADGAEARVRDVEALLRRFTRGDDDPARLLERLRIAERENGELRDRLDRGREGVERLLARIRFLEEKR
jgi:predicted RNase H-like nuclease (RuvC/YqgF family)